MTTIYRRRAGSLTSGNRILFRSKVAIVKQVTPLDASRVAISYEVIDPETGDDLGLEMVNLSTRKMIDVITTRI